MNHSAAATKRNAQSAARDRLLGWIQPGDTIYTVLRHVSKSGLMRVIGVVLLQHDDDGRIIDLHPNYAVADLLGLRMHSDWQDGVKVQGGGMDMGFWLTYSIASALWPDGFDCIGEGCPSNDHSNGLREYGAGIHHGDGGYTIRHRWL